MDLTELPKCTVCLERMDESVNGILTTLCNHSFHSQVVAPFADCTVGLNQKGISDAGLLDFPAQRGTQNEITQVNKSQP
ncbi:hypothetical protein H8959_015158 [Pygathrix nigripes]